MALKIKFQNGSEVEYSSAVEMEEFYNGSSRRTLTFEIAPASVNIQELSDLCTEDNCGVLELINEEAELSNIYEGYVLRLNVGVKQSYDAIAEQAREIVELKLGKRTYIEQKLHELGID